jgi:hypothetical protein
MLAPAQISLIKQNRTVTLTVLSAFSSPLLDKVRLNHPGKPILAFGAVNSLNQSLPNPTAAVHCVESDQGRLKNVCNSAPNAVKSQAIECYISSKIPFGK